MTTISSLLTIALITKNEERVLADCLASVRELGCPIVIIDSGSSDATPEIAQQYGAAFHVFADWQGFGAQRNRAHQFIQTPWVLWLDADERLSEATRQDLIQQISQTEANGKTLFAINRLSIAYGREIRHSGWYPDYIVRCYPIAHTQYSEDLVHESVVVPKGAQIARLKGDVLHDIYRDFNHHVSKLKDYAFAWAAQRQGKKHATPLTAILRAIATFLITYIIRRGFLDGRQGLLIAALSAMYTFLKYSQLWYLNQSQSTPK